MFDWLKNLFSGGSNKSSGSNSRPAPTRNNNASSNRNFTGGAPTRQGTGFDRPLPQDDSLMLARKREEEERKKREEAEKKKKAEEAARKLEQMARLKQQESFDQILKKPAPKPIDAVFDPAQKLAKAPVVPVIEKPAQPQPKPQPKFDIKKGLDSLMKAPKEFAKGVHYVLDPTEGFQDLAKGIAEHDNYNSKAAKEAREATARLQQQNIDLARRAGQKLKDPNVSPAEKERWKKTLASETRRGTQQFRDADDITADTIESTDPIEGAINTVGVFGALADAKGVATAGNDIFKAIKANNLRKADDGAKVAPVVKPTVAPENKVEVAPGVKTSITSAPTKYSDKPPLRTNTDLDSPAFLRKQEAQDEAVSSKQAELKTLSELAPTDIDAPAFQRQQVTREAPVQSVMNPTDLEIPAYLRREGAEKLPEPPAFNPTDLSAPAYLRQQNPGPVNIPNPATDRALLKATDIPAQAGLNDVPIANFRDSVSADVPLQKAPPVQAPVANATGVDVNGNVAPQTDIEMARQLQAQGVVPERGNSVVATQEDEMARAADDELRAEATRLRSKFNMDPDAPPEQLERFNAIQAELSARIEAQRAAQDAVTRPPVDLPADIKAPRSAEQLIAGENMADLEAVVTGLNRKGDAINLTAASNVGAQQANRMDLDALIAKYSPNAERPPEQAIGPQIDTPESFFEAIAAAERLKGVDGAADAKVSIYNAILDKVSESGVTLRAVQELWDVMPPAYKTESLLRRMAKAGVDEPDAYRADLLKLIEESDASADAANAIRTQLDEIADGLATGRLADDATTRGQVDKLVNAENKLIRDAEFKKGEVRDFVESVLPEQAFGQKAADTARVSMLSSILGRAYDAVATTTVGTIDNIANAASALAGKGLNKLYGDGAAIDTLPNPVRQVKQVKEGFQDTMRHTFAGERRVPGTSDVLSKAPVRSEIQPNGSYNWDTPLKKVGNSIRNFVTGTVESTTNLTSGLRVDRQFQLAMQNAKKNGVPDENLDLYAKATQNSKTAINQIDAEQYHLRTNNLQRNALSNAINTAFKSFENSTKNNPLMRNIGPIIESNLLPFKSWVFGNISRAVTDANVISNVFGGNGLIQSIRRQDAQGIADATGKLVANGGVITAGYLLAGAGTIVDEDANGNTYAGKYFDFDGMRIPVAVLGPYAVPLILGANADKASKEEGGMFNNLETVAWDSLAQAGKSIGATATLGGSNTVMSAIDTASQEGATWDDVGPNLVRGAVGQYIPAAFGDVNSGLDMTGLNPTGENADPKVTMQNEEGKEVKDNWATMQNQLKDRIPGWSQTLPRKAGELSQNVIDRMLKATRESDSAKTARIQKESLADGKKALEDEGIPTTSEEIKALAEEGDYESAIKGAQYRLRELEAKEKPSKTSIKNARDDIEKYKLQQDGVPVTDDGVKARMESGEYDLAIRGMEYKLSNIENDSEKPESEKQELRQKIGRTNVYREGAYEPDVVKAYESSEAKEGGIGVTKWRELMESGDPEMVAYATKLAELDTKMVDGKFATTAKYYWKGGKGGSGKGGSGRGRGGGGGSGGSGMQSYSVDVTNNSVDFNPGKLVKREINMNTPQSAIPVLKKVQNYDTSKLKKIKVTRGRVL